MKPYMKLDGRKIRFWNSSSQVGGGIGGWGVTELVVCAGEREREREREREKKEYVLSYQWSIIFKIFTIMSLNNAIQKLKYVLVCFQNTMFKQPKLRTITWTLLIKYSYQTCFFFFFFGNSFQCLNTENYCLKLHTKWALGDCFCIEPNEETMLHSFILTIIWFPHNTQNNYSYLGSICYTHLIYYIHSYTYA